MGEAVVDFTDLGESLVCPACGAPGYLWYHPHGEAEGMRVGWHCPVPDSCRARRMMEDLRELERERDATMPES